MSARVAPTCPRDADGDLLAVAAELSGASIGGCGEFRTLLERFAAVLREERDVTARQILELYVVAHWVVAKNSIRFWHVGQFCLEVANNR